MGLLSRILIKTLFIGITFCAVNAGATSEFDGMDCTPDLNPMACMVCNVYFESRGESNEGKLAVAQTVFTRLYSQRFEDRICENIYAKSQFSWTADGKPDVLPRPGHREYPALREVIKMAFRAFFEEGPNGYTHFHATWANPSWRYSKQCQRKPPIQIDGHIFYDCGGGDTAIRRYEEFLEGKEIFVMPAPRPDWHGVDQELAESISLE